MAERNLTEVRETVADVLTAAADEVNVRARGPVKTPRVGDGWVTVSRLSPASYTACLVTLVVVIVLGADEPHAEELLELWAVDLIDAVTTADDLHVGDVALEPVTISVGMAGTPLFAITLTVTTEVET